MLGVPPWVDIQRQNFRTRLNTSQGRTHSTRTHSVSSQKACFDSVVLADNSAPAPDTTFLNVVVWNSDRLFPDYNPGNTDPTTGTLLLANIAAAYTREPDTSPLKPNIERNFEYFQRAALAMRPGSNRAWWEGSQESLTNSSAANVTEYLNNLTLPSNVTLPKNLTLSASKSTSVCAGAGQGNAAGCGGQDDVLVATS